MIAPADGTVLFAGPFRGHDGIVIIDHGRRLDQPADRRRQRKPRGARSRRGEPLGRALGPLGVELRQNGVPVSPALIAGFICSAVK